MKPFGKWPIIDLYFIELLTYLVILLFRYLPTQSNIETNRLENEVRALILKVVQRRKQASASTQHTDILQTILDSAENMSELCGESAELFIVDNFKNIFLAGYETAATSAVWTLMLLATNPDWQERARAEVLEICGGQNPNHDMARKMKIVSLEFDDLSHSLRFYVFATIYMPDETTNIKQE